MMKSSIALVVLFAAFFFSCDQGQVATAPDFTGSGKEFVEMLIKGDYAAAVAKFDGTMKGVMPEEKLAQAWLSLLQQVGAFERIDGVSQKKEQGYDVVYVTCTFERAGVNVKVVYNTDKEVSGLWFVPK
jgi:hypothetical protein